MAASSDDALIDLLRRVKTIAVIGVKAGEQDDAFRVPRYLQQQGYRVLPVSPKLDALLGERCVPALAQLEEHPGARERLEAAGIFVVEDRCLMVEHARLFGRRPAH